MAGNGGAILRRRRRRRRERRKEKRVLWKLSSILSWNAAPGRTPHRSRQNNRGGKICCENRRRRKLNADFCHGGDWASKDLFWKRRRRVNKVKWKTFVGGKEGNHGEYWKIGISVIILLGEHLGNLEWMSGGLKWKLFVFRTSNPTKGQTFSPAPTINPLCSSESLGCQTFVPVYSYCVYLL